MHEKQTDGGRASMCPAGYTIILATDPAQSPEFLDELRAIVRRSLGGMLISLREPARWSGGPVLSVHLRPAGDEQVLTRGVWLGPLREPSDRDEVCGWLLGGGPLAGPPPVHLQSAALPSATRAIMAARTMN